MQQSTVALWFAALAFTCCCKGPVVPPDARKSPREYTWTKTVIGTGAYQIAPRDIWGSSPKDVYVVGHASHLFIGKIWHFNGSAWNDLTTTYIESHNEAYPGKSIYHWTPWGVWGFGPNDVWIVGSRDTSEIPQPVKQGFVMRYDGQVWREVAIPGANSLYCIWGRSPTDLWLAGELGRFHHYDGLMWSEYFVGDTIFVNFFGGAIDSTLYASGLNLGNTPGNPHVYDSFLEWTGSGWTIAEVSVNYSKFATVSVVENEFYSVSGETIRKRMGVGNWPIVFNVPSSHLGRVKGMSKSNIIALGSAETIVHFDGNDWRRLTSFSDPEIRYTNLFFLESSIFLVGKDTGESYGYLVHGR